MPRNVRLTDNPLRMLLTIKKGASAVDLFAMKAFLIAFLFFVAPILGFAQPKPGQLDQVALTEFQKQVAQDSVHIWVGSQVAESLLTHRVEPVMPSSDVVGARISATVTIAFEITGHGKVRHAIAVSGPRLLRPTVLAAVKQWTFKPYVFNGKPTPVATSVPLAVSNF